MNITRLKSFIAVAERKSFSKASEEVYIAQPTLSKHIAQLEEELDVKLLERNKHEVRLLPAGEVLYSEGKDLLSRIQEIEKKVYRTAQKMPTELKIGYAPVYSNGIWEAFSAFSKAYPDILFTAKQLQVNSEQNALIRGDADAAIVFINPESQVQDGIIIEKIHSIPLVFVCGKNSPLSFKKHITYDDFQDETLYFLQNTPDSSMQEHHKNLIKYFRRFENVKEWGTLLMNISSSKGIALFPKSIAKDFSNNCCILTVPEFSENTELSIIHLSCNTNPYISRFLELFQTVAFPDSTW